MGVQPPEWVINLAGASVQSDQSECTGIFRMSCSFSPERLDSPKQTVCTKNAGRPAQRSPECVFFPTRATASQKQNIQADDNCLQVRHVVRFNTDRTIFDDSVHLSDREVGIDTGMKNLPQ